MKYLIIYFVLTENFHYRLSSQVKTMWTNLHRTQFFVLSVMEYLLHKVMLFNIFITFISKDVHTTEAKAVPF